MRSPHDFDDKLNEAALWEKRIAEKIEKMHLRTYHTRLIPYDNIEDRKIQRSGIDFTISSESAGWEIKTRSRKYYLDGILLETVSVVEKNIPGWLYTSKADIIAYVWLNESKSNLMQKGYFIMLKELRKTWWYNRLPGRYHVYDTPSERKTDEGTIYWDTKFITPPINDFPDGTLTPFNALLPSNHEQLKLGGK